MTRSELIISGLRSSFLASALAGASPSDDEIAFEFAGKRWRISLGDEVSVRWTDLASDRYCGCLGRIVGGHGEHVARQVVGMIARHTAV